jgi:DNA repair exonuclease SbcCD ATPase subunit
MFSYGENNTLELNTEPITQLVGLNGHGKSSIPLILEEVLFNKNSKGVKKGDIPNRELAAQKYSASLDFELDGTEYRIELSRSGAQQKVKLLQNGTDISSHTATDTFKQVEQLIGLDFKTFSQIVYQNSQSSLQFLTATDTARKNFLIGLL